MDRNIELCCHELYRRHPHLELAIQRLARSDARFSAICRDYAEAIGAACSSALDQRQKDDLKAMAEELLDEALRHLGECDAGHPGQAN